MERTCACTGTCAWHVRAHAQTCTCVCAGARREDPGGDGESAEDVCELWVGRDVGVVDVVHLQEEVLGGVGADELLRQHALEAGAVRLVERVGLLLAE